jgi:MFS transporter, MHS family, proline/betaine transporter
MRALHGGPGAIVDARVTTPEPRAHPVRSVVAASLGNALEWFDNVIYGFFAPSIARQFFPNHDPKVSLLIALGTFGVSFFFRPLGGVVIGAYADRAGRKAALLLTMLLMLAGTAIIAFMPSYQTIGVAAPIMVVLARLLQGFSAGGEFGSATTFLAEQSPAHRAFYSSWQFASQGLTTLLAAASGVLIESMLTTQQVNDWGWRLPFFLGLMIGPVALYIRRHVDESPEFVRSQPASDPLRDAIRSQKYRMLIGLGAVMLATVTLYILLYLPTYAVRELGLRSIDGFRSTLTAGALLFVLSPLSGLASDRFGRLAVIMPCALVLVAVPIPLFTWMTRAPAADTLLISQALLAMVAAGYLGGLPALLTELFPVRNRSTGVSLSYNLSVALFGGLAPFTITWLIATTSDRAAPGYYLTGAAICSIVALLAARRLGYR